MKIIIVLTFWLVWIVVGYLDHSRMGNCKKNMWKCLVKSKLTWIYVVISLFSAIYW